jgi:type IV pilus assembly protein PilW
MIGHRQHGMTLVELMVGMVLALIVIGVAGSLYVTNKQVTRVNTSISRLQENGRFAMHVFEDDLRMAGFTGICGNTVAVNSVLNSTAFPYQFNIGIAGFHGTGSFSPSLDASIAGLSPPPLQDRDVVTIRRFDASPVALTAEMGSPTDVLTVAAGSPLANGDLLLVADCTAAAIFQVTGYGGGVISHATGAGTPGNSSANLGHAFGTDASVYRLVTRTYYIAPSAKKPGSNSLWANSSPSYPGVAQPEELAEGVEQLLLLYGEDTDSPPDRAANKYVTAENVTTWRNVVSVRLQTLLATTSDSTTTSPQPYTFNGATTTPTDRRLRTPLTSVITLRNRAL